VRDSPRLPIVGCGSKFTQRRIPKVQNAQFDSLSACSVTNHKPEPFYDQNAGPSLELILTKAKARVANHIRNTPDVNGLEPFLMVIEDEFGDLVHTQGDLSFLMPSAPVLRQCFASQLNAEIEDQ
jgi:hypothetical protein